MKNEDICRLSAAILRNVIPEISDLVGYDSAEEHILVAGAKSVLKNEALRWNNVKPEDYLRVLLPVVELHLQGAAARVEANSSADGTYHQDTCLEDCLLKTKEAIEAAISIESAADPLGAATRCCDAAADALMFAEMADMASAGVYEKAKPRRERKRKRYDAFLKIGSSAPQGQELASGS